MKKETINIKVVVAERNYPLKIEAGEEELVRKAAKWINEQTKEFRQKYDVKDKQDYLAMIALMLAVEQFKLEDKIKVDSSFMEKLNELDGILSDFLKK